MLTVAQAAKRASVSESLVYAWCNEGVLIHVRFGRPGKRGTIRIEEEDLENLIQTMKISEVVLEDESEIKWLKK
jgi:excisionase family DNA binding protein